MTGPLRRPAESTHDDTSKNETGGALPATLQTIKNATFIVSVKEIFLNLMLDGNAARFVAAQVLSGKSK